MKILALLRGKSATSEPVTLDSLLVSLVPADLPARVSTLAKAERRRAEISAHENTLGLGPEMSACRAVARAHDDLLERLSLRDRVAATHLQAAAADRAADRDLIGARKLREQREAERDIAAAASKFTAEKLSQRMAERQGIDGQRSKTLAEAERALHDAIAAGDEAAEHAAAGALRQAHEVASNPAAAELDVRVTALNKLHEQRTAAATAAEAALREAEHAELAAQIAVVCVRSDRAAGEYATALLSEVRLRVAARDAGHEDLAGLAGLNQQVFVHDRARVWFAPPDPDSKCGVVALGKVVMRMARMLEQPVDGEALRADLRHMPEAAALAA